jgi:uncharacterized protein YkwD
VLPVRLLPRRPTVALALVLALAATLTATQLAGAESASTCLAKLNSTRRGAGLPLVTSSRPLAVAAERHANYRARADALGQRDASAHYETRGRAYYSGVRPWDRTKAAGLRDGTWARQGENVVTGHGSSLALNGVAAWLDAPYHRFPMLDANMRQVGCAPSRGYASASRAAEVLEMVWPWNATRKQLTAWPLPNRTGVATSFDRRTEAPSPLRMSPTAVVGPVISLQASGWTHIRLTSAPTLKRGSTPVAVHYSTPNGDPYLPDNAVMLAAKSPLAGRTKYTVRVKGQLQTKAGAAWTSFTRTWSFTTR